MPFSTLFQTPYGQILKSTSNVGIGRRGGIYVNSIFPVKRHRISATRSACSIRQRNNIEPIAAGNPMNKLISRVALFLFV